MQIRELNPKQNPEHLAALLPAFQRAFHEYAPGYAGGGATRLRLWCADGYRQQTLVFAAFADEQATEAEGLVDFRYELDKNLDLAEFSLVVTRAGRAHGVDDALLAHCLRQTAELGRKRLAIGLPSRFEPAEFAERRGATYTDTSVQSTLELGTIDRAQYAAWAAPSAKNAEYTLVRWIDRCPEELVESYTAAQDAMADQPMGDYRYEFAKNDADRLRFHEDQAVGLGIRRYVQAAVGPDGAVAGYNMIAAYPDEPEVADIWDTGVARAHRGHGLGLRIKSASTLWLEEDRPGTRRLRTFNDSENRWMLAVNRTMGYLRTDEWQGYEFPIG